MYMHVMYKYTSLSETQCLSMHIAISFVLVHCAEELASLKMEFHVCVICRNKILQEPRQETDIGWVEDGVVQV